ncbi:MAG: type III-B CRISPR module-associated Cmr3 family protein [Treponema succinifaciens]|uniref:type III-B CRISPR module-associated Cmr3 family protein n=1 Tax=Treponema succinifaciens TaxID=167 RepID=UPI0023F43797|nr:type III-B CRISPR module-associated Cmr3 family protein [Treponema succinifaciens]MDD6961880.1 type III-B CRISPR module-associated Cmr3 family protein [Treponema succinifaciens]MDY5116331.1 type III-B CRISPR module-associated Cmr3 family protein [Treponema succinifaciens]
MSVFYEIISLDTLFFRGSTPMEAGQNVAVSMFPPPVSVIEGSFRTAFLLQKGISPEDYASGKDTSANEIIGNPSEKAAFKVSSILIKKNGQFYAKVPASWYLDSEKKPKEKTDYIGKTIVEAKRNQKFLDDMFVMSSSESLPFAQAKGNAQPLGNLWVSIDFINSARKVLEENDFLLQNEILAFEQRTGIALDSSKHTVEGQLYSASHIRLLDGVSMIVGISKEIGLKDSGKIQLGGERRLCNYRKIDFCMPEKSENMGNQFLSPAPVEATKEILESLIASSKLVITSGWDLAKGFHKPTTSWIPAGAVFTKNINGICIPLNQR